VYAECIKRPLPLHVDVVGPVDHDLADLRVFEQTLDGPEADDFVGDLIDHVGDRGRRQDRSFLPQHREDFLSDPEPALRSRCPLKLGHGRPEQAGPHPIPDPGPIHAVALHPGLPQSEVE
jgi:hypothetical protein